MDRVDSASAGGGDSGALVFYPPVSGDPLYVMGTLSVSINATTSDPSDGTSYCTSNCGFYYNNWYAIQGHLSRYFVP